MVNRKELNPEASPRAAFGARLRSVREARGVTQDDLGDQMEYSGQHVSAVETGRKPPTLRFARRADLVLDVGDEFEREWRDLRQGSLLEGFPEYVRCEERAVEIRIFEVGAIPGLVQTPEYAAAVEAANVKRGTIPPEQAEERLTFLAERQAALERPNPPIVIAVLDESCIRRMVGGSEVMGAQLAQLVAFADQSYTMLQIVPFAIGERCPFSRVVNLLTLADRSVVSYVESQTRGYLDRDIPTVVPLVRAYHQLQAEALSQAASVALINEVRKGIL
ncbi:helix-turn-helix transcriptional regulator [Streptomyces sp. NPDC088124]|uniref:helix-turn-helix domain-containing protein n=1 Tax=Streptomyces sp. NPDC088124 TaxID=3154654 RepID=UPI003413AB5D